MSLWKIDPTHSEITFKVKHLVVSTVTGHFRNFEASVESERDNFSDAVIKFKADINSIDTKNEQRDQHLKSADFFDGEKYPELSFESSSVKKISDSEFEVYGKLEIRGIKKHIKLNVIYNGKAAGFGGTEVAGFEIRGKVNRFDYDLKWNAMTEAGGVVVSNEVKLEILAEFHKAESSVKAA